MNKREFVIGGCTVALGSGALLAAAPALAGSPGRLGRLPEVAVAPRQDAWQRYLNHDFAVEGAGQKLTLQEIRRHQGSALHEQFTLVFSAANQRALGAGTRTLRHASGQRIAVYVEPMGSSATRRGDAATYAAHFSLLV